MSDETDVMRIKIAEWKEQGRDPDRAEQLFELIIHDMEWAWASYWEMNARRNEVLGDLAVRDVKDARDSRQS